ncbi:fungal-specific transcription factor domain-containing protein [Favolaschia claudopus]|uniref:Fungal-specific transcription factor domain-containing protein n=1 Tax=Favolaschia claudopus TaxID=2862362 RepID=A0AAW0BEH7_9AGAR
MLFEDRLPGKKKRVCDRCRRIKSNGQNLCAACAANGLACTYQSSAAVRAAVPDLYNAGYLKELEARLQNAQAALEEMRGPQRHFVRQSMSDYIGPSSESGLDDGFHGVAASFQALSLNDTAPPDPGFQGQSSSSMLVKAAVALKSGCPSNNDKTAPAAKPWPLTPWRESPQTHPALSFPSPHLLRTLLSLYFTHFNRFVPLLHRPTFERSIEDNIHLYRQDFAHTVLLVCALGSLHLPTTESCPELAWKWYDQVDLCGSSLRCQPTIYDLQAYCLAAHFQLQTCDIRTSWRTIGFGLRIAEDIGAHRRNLDAKAVSTEGELETRAAWAAFMLDAQLGIALGRQIAINPFDLDIRLASECDDEHWETTGPGKQPPYTPSSIVFFNCSVTLYRILHFLVKNLYSTSRFYTAYESATPPFPLVVSPRALAPTEARGHDTRSRRLDLAIYVFLHAHGPLNCLAAHFDWRVLGEILSFRPTRSPFPAPFGG